MSEDNDEIGISRRVVMRDKEQEEKKLPPLAPNLRCCRYRPGESRMFDSEADIPPGQGWSDQRSVYYQKPGETEKTPEIESPAAISAPAVASEPQTEMPASKPPKRRGRMAAQ